MKALLSIIFTFAAAVISAQNLLTPSKKGFEKKWIKNTSYQMTWYALKDTGKAEIGKVATHIAIDKSRLTVVTNVSVKNMETTWVDSTMAVLKTLQPIRHASFNRQRDMVLNFGRVVTGFYKDKIKNTNFIIADTTKIDYFDSNIYPLLIGWLPLGEGYTQHISIYDYNPAGKIGIIKASINSVKSGTYQSDKHGSRNVWVVTVSDEIGSGENGVSTYYFDKVDRQLWKQEMAAKGRKMMMRLVE